MSRIKGVKAALLSAHRLCANRAQETPSAAENHTRPVPTVRTAPPTPADAEHADVDPAKRRFLWAAGPAWAGGGRLQDPLMTASHGLERLQHLPCGAGATGWMVKPFDPAKLLEVIKKVIR